MGIRFNNFVGLCLSISLLFGPLDSAFAQDKKESTEGQQMLLDKTYQRMLFAYFQGDFFNSLSLFEHIEKQAQLNIEKVNNPGIAPTLLKGAMSLAYGLDQQALSAFNIALSEYKSDENQVLAWFLLAKSLYQQEQIELSAEAVDNIDLDFAQSFLTPTVWDELVFLMANLRSRGEVVKSDVKLIDLISADSPYRHYMHYNHAIKMVSQDNISGAVASLQTFTPPPSDFSFDWFDWWTPLYSVQQPEIDALKDRTQLTLGYLLLEHNDPAQAVTAFQQVRVNSMDTQAALLGWGWSVAKQEDYPLALAIWRSVIDGKTNDEYEFEAYLASAFAFEQASSPAAAFAILAEGLTRYQQALNQLQDVHQLVQSDLYLMNVISGTPSEHPILERLLLKESLQRGLQQMQQVSEIDSLHQTWQKKLASFRHLLDEREVLASSRIDKLSTNDVFERLGAFQVEQHNLQSLISRAELGEHQLLLDDSSMQTLARLERAIATFEHVQQQKSELSQQPLSSRYQQRLARLQGVFTWLISEGSEERLYQAKTELKQLSLLIEETKTNQTRLQQRLTRAPDYASQRSTINQLSGQLQQQMRQNQAVKKTVLESFRATLLAEIDANTKQLKSYQLHANMSIARLQDNAYQQSASSLEVKGEAYGQ